MNTRGKPGKEATKEIATSQPKSIVSTPVAEKLKLDREALNKSDRELLDKVGSDGAPTFFARESTLVDKRAAVHAFNDNEKTAITARLKNPVNTPAAAAEPVLPSKRHHKP